MTGRNGFGIVAAGLCALLLPACLGRQTRPDGPPGAEADGPPLDAPPARSPEPPPGPYPGTTRINPPPAYNLTRRPVEPPPIQPAHLGRPDPAEPRNASPPVVPEAVQTLPAVPVRAEPPDPPLVLAVRAYLNNRPDEAVEHLKAYDKSNQDLLLGLLPLVVRLTEGGLGSAEPQELAVLVEQLQGATAALRCRAALRTENVCFCRWVRGFGKVEPLPADRAFRPRELAQLYVEFRNFTRDPVGEPAAAGAGIRNRGYAVRLASRLEIRDAANGLVWRKEFDTADLSQTPPADYFINYCFPVPDIPPGAYTLWLHVLDKPTNRATKRAIDFRITRSAGPGEGP